MKKLFTIGCPVILATLGVALLAVVRKKRKEKRLKRLRGGGGSWGLGAQRQLDPQPRRPPPTGSWHPVNQGARLWPLGRRAAPPSLLKHSWCPRLPPLPPDAAPAWPGLPGGRPTQRAGVLVKGLNRPHADRERGVVPSLTRRPWDSPGTQPLKGAPVRALRDLAQP